MRNNKPVSALYIHIPFCHHLCFYCDFTKTIYNKDKVKLYLKSLRDEIDAYHIPFRSLKTIYIGGGTPSSLDIEELKELLEIVKPYTDGVEEYTFEANPESLSEEKIALLVEYGVNRISLGVQTSDDEVLLKIGRKHTFNDVVKVASLLHKYHIDNISFDLILTLPEVDTGQLCKDIDNLLALKPKHISCYALEVHDDTVFAKMGIKEADQDTIYQEYEIVNNILVSHGYHHYEVSNWGLAGYYSKHNLTYWMNEEYYGCGLGTSGYLNGVRYKNTIDLDTYNSGHYLDSSETVTESDEIEYDIMLPLRTEMGIDDNEFKKKHGYSLLETKEKEISEMIENGYLKPIKNHKIICTFNGLMALNSVILELID